MSHPLKKLVQGLAAITVLASGSASYANHEDLQELSLELNSEAQTVLHIVEAVVLGGTSRERIAIANVEALADRTAYFQTEVQRNGAGNFDLVDEAFLRADRTIGDLRNVHQVIPSWRRIESLVLSIRDVSGGSLGGGGIGGIDGVDDGVGGIGFGEDQVTELVHRIDEDAAQVLRRAEAELRWNALGASQALTALRELASAARDLHETVESFQNSAFAKERLDDALVRANLSLSRVRVSQQLRIEFSQLRNEISSLDEVLGSQGRPHNQNGRRSRDRGNTIVIGG